MKSIVKFFVLIMVLVFITGCGNTRLQLTKEQCLQKPKAGFMWANGECLNKDRFGGYKKDKVLVFLHGSSTRWTDAKRNYMHPAMTISGRTGITSYVFNMPGYAGSSANIYDKMRYSKSNFNPIKKDFIEYTASILEQIKKEENAKTLYVFGHSSGGTLASTIAGFKPGLINYVMTYEGTYDWVYTRTLNGLAIRFSSDTAVNYLDDIENTKFLIMYGAKSNRTRAQEAEKFKNDLLEKGKEVQVIKFDELGHDVDSEIFDVVLSYIQKN